MLLVGIKQLQVMLTYKIKINETFHVYILYMNSSLKIRCVESHQCILV